MDLPVGLLINFGAATLKKVFTESSITSDPPRLRASAPPREPITLNESIVEAAALSWFEELGYAVGYVPPYAHSDT